MTFEMTRTEARNLARYIAEMRSRSGGPHWDTPGIEDALAKARTIAPSPDLALAAIKAAREPGNRTPAIIGMEGAHWRTPNTKPRHLERAPHDRCAVCSESRARCIQLWSEDHTFRPSDQHYKSDVPRIVDALRDAKREAVPSPPKAETTTRGTERVAPARAALAAARADIEETE